jgi:hypothetical protein
LTFLHSPASLPPLAFQTFLFNEPAHLATQPCPEYHTFYSLQNGVAQARMSVFLENGRAFSPYRGSFGSVEMAGDLSETDLKIFLAEVLEFVQKQDCQKFYIRHPPACYHPEVAGKVKNVLLFLGFQVSLTDLNFHFPVTDQTFESRLHLSERRRLRKCENSGFQLVEEKNPNIPEVYAFIQNARKRKNYSLSLDLASLEKLFSAFPEQYQVFSVRSQNQLVALTVTVRVNEQILYNFYPADHAEFLNFSPIVFLLKGLYAYCQSRNIGIIDLGTATDQGMPLPGLIRFKQNLGAETSEKQTFLMC